MVINFLNTFKSEIFMATVIIVHYILYALLYFNVNLINEKTVLLLNVILQISISLFLIFRFLFRKSTTCISTFDKKVIVSSATFILINAVTNYFFEK